MDYRITTIAKHNDKRGRLVVFLKKSELEARRRNFGQIYFITFNRKGTIRGNHYHKKWREWFGIVTGSVQVELEDVRTKRRVSLALSARKNTYTRLEIGPYIAHTFVSKTNFSSLLNYADDEWRASDRYEYKLSTTHLRV